MLMTAEEVRMSKQVINDYLDMVVESIGNPTTPDCHFAYLIGKMEYCKRILNDVKGGIETAIIINGGEAHVGIK